MTIPEYLTVMRIVAGVFLIAAVVILWCARWKLRRRRRQGLRSGAWVHGLMAFGLPALVLAAVAAAMRFAKRTPASAEIPIAQTATPTSQSIQHPAVPAHPGKPSPDRVRNRMVKVRSAPITITGATIRSVPAPASVPEVPPGAAPQTSTPPLLDGATGARAVAGPEHAIVPAGATLTIRTENILSAARNLPGDIFPATLEEPLTADGHVIAATGSRVVGLVRWCEKAGGPGRASSLAITLIRLEIPDGQTLSISTDSYEVQGEAHHNSGVKKGGVAGRVGAVIGAAASRAKSAAIRAGARVGQDVAIPGKSRLSFHLMAPLRVSKRQ
jgi:hypothetical protein